MDFVQRKFRISGRVQGVCFRAWTQEVARELGLRGGVRNLPDGSVEILAGGPSRTMATFEERLWQGPPSARVQAVESLESTLPLVDGPFSLYR